MTPRSTMLGLVLRLDLKLNGRSGCWANAPSPINSPERRELILIPSLPVVENRCPNVGNKSRKAIFCLSTITFVSCIMRKFSAPKKFRTIYNQKGIFYICGAIFSLCLQFQFIIYSLGQRQVLRQTLRQIVVGDSMHFLQKLRRERRQPRHFIHLSNFYEKNIKNG